MLNIQKDISLKEFSTFKIGGHSKYFVRVCNIDELKEIIGWINKNGVNFAVLGGGSNALFPDKYFDGLIIKIENNNIQLTDNIITVGAGTSLLKLILSAKDNFLSGLEWGAGIPGTVGGAICGNAGAFGGEIKDCIKEVRVLNVKRGTEEILSKIDCQFSYRNSVFKNNKRYIILEGVFSLKKGDKSDIEGTIREKLLYRAQRHPLDMPSAGSTFKNVKFQNNISSDIDEKFSKKGEIPAAYLIDNCGLKGKKIGGAQISYKHPNFIVNAGGAKAEDVKNLIAFVKKEIKNKFGFDIIEEIIIF
jgi:UDP-N-acetylmuramate dehydrogenase